MKLTLVFSIFVLILGLPNASGQNYLDYYQTINKAEIANLDGNYKQSDSLYQTSFKQVKKPFKEDYLLASLNSEKLKDYQSTYSYLITGISHGLTIKRIKKQLDGFKKTEQWKNLKNEYDSLRENHLKTLNLALREEVSEMIRKDQTARMPILGNLRKMKKVDNYNYNRLIAIINENGEKWPGFSTIGEVLPKGKYDVTDNIALMLLHFNKEQIENLKPYMLEAVLEGEMYPYHYARAIDYKNIDYKNTCQIYGTYIAGGYMFEICDCEKANLERNKIGLETLEDYYRKRNSKYKCANER